jgi:hypothetical protein
MRIFVDIRHLGLDFVEKYPDKYSYKLFVKIKFLI